jgi:hypothetical protein
LRHGDLVGHQRWGLGWRRRRPTAARHLSA